MKGSFFVASYHAVFSLWVMNTNFLPWGFPLFIFILFYFSTFQYPSFIFFLDWKAIGLRSFILVFLFFIFLYSRTLIWKPCLFLSFSFSFNSFFFFFFLFYFLPTKELKAREKGKERKVKEPIRDVVEIHDSLSCAWLSLSEMTHNETIKG